VTLFLGFAVAIPLVPFHRWLIAAVSEAPAPVGVVVAAVVVRAGVYGILRVSVGLLPDGSRWASTTVVALAVVTVLFGAVAATRDRSLRPLVVHLAVSQAGLSLVGLGAMTREGIAGCLVQMTSGGVAIALLLTLVAVVHDRLLSGDLDRLAGLRASMPYGVTALAVAALALVGMPGLSGFWGAALSLLGAFPVQRWLSVAAVVGTVVAAVAAVRGVASFARPAPSRTTSAAATDDLLPREIAAVVPLLVLTLALGLSPAPFFTLVRGGIADLNQLVNPPGPDEVASVAAPRATA
jgi:NADH-quinone oxidoreductase subunit M